MILILLPPALQLALKGLKKILDKGLSPEKQAQLQYNFGPFSTAKRLGISILGGLLSLLENQPQLVAVGSPSMDMEVSAVAEIFSAHKGLSKCSIKSYGRVDQRKALTIAEYEKIFFEEAQLDAEGNKNLQKDQTFALSEINEHQRTLNNR